LAKIRDNRVEIQGPSVTSLLALDSSPPSIPPERTQARWYALYIVAVSARFFVVAFTADGYASRGLAPGALSTTYVHDRRLNTWREIKSACSVPYARRIFGDWLATIVEIHKPDQADPPNPGRENESPKVADLYARYAGLYTSIPGILLLDNLEDGRRITINTGQEDSEILAVRSDGLVLYRVNDSIFAAQIEGNKLAKPSLVVKDLDVPQIHWAFWSAAARS
jgi:hypothetical protein